MISPMALEAVKRIDVLFDIERAINGRPAGERPRIGKEKSAPLMTELEAWMREERAKLSKHAAVAKAFDYMLRRWDGFARFLEDGRIRLTNNSAERALGGSEVWPSEESHGYSRDPTAAATGPPSCTPSSGRQN